MFWIDLNRDWNAANGLISLSRKLLTKFYMTKGILCTTDFSASSRNAVEWAVSLAQHLKAPLTILHTYRLIRGHNGEVVQMKRKMEEEARQKFSVLEAETLKDKGISYNFKIEVGFVADRIEEHSRKNPLSFLVMDKSMSTGNKESFDELVKQAQIPLVIVP